MDIYNNQYLIIEVIYISLLLGYKFSFFLFLVFLLKNIFQLLKININTKKNFLIKKKNYKKYLKIIIKKLKINI